MKMSVIIPNYNNAKYLKRCLDSVLEQTLNDIEIIIVDDGSTDNSVDVIENIINVSNRNINLIKQYNQNAAVARNRGIENSSGEYLYFLDSDDELADKKVLEKIYNDIEDNDILIGNYMLINDSSDIFDKYQVSNDNLINNDTQFKYSLISPVPSNKLYKRELIINNKIYFDNVRIGQDLNFYLKYLCVSNKLKIVDYDIYKYRILNNSMSRNISYNFLDIIKSFEGVKKFYCSIGNEDEYNKFIVLCELIHYNSQMEKIIKIDNFKKKNMIYKYFMFFIDQINLKNVQNNQIYKSNIRQIKFKKYFKAIYFSKLYIYLKNKK